MARANPTSRTPTSMIASPPAADPDRARAHFEERLAVETDAWDLHADMEAGRKDFILIDARSRSSYDAGHIPGALSLPYREISADSTSKFPKESVIVTYCDGYFCNASTKAAARLAALGFRVKELRDGVRGWNEEGFTVEVSAVHLTASKRA